MAVPTSFSLTSHVLLPDAARAIIDPAKVRDYLLAFDHPTGRGKARFFTGLGFSREHWRELHSALFGLAQSGEAAVVAPNAFGTKYTVTGSIEGPRGRLAHVVSVWIILHGEQSPRFLTAYPGDSK